MTYWAGIPLKPLTNDDIGIRKILAAKELALTTSLDEAANAALDFYKAKKESKPEVKKPEEKKS